MVLLGPVAAEVASLRRAYPRATVEVHEDGQGGAQVVVDPVPLGPPFAQASTWVGFHVTYLHPQADIYPFHVRADLTRLDGQALGAGTSTASFLDSPSVQLSRRSNGRDLSLDSAAAKLARVIAWLKNK